MLEMPYMMREFVSIAQVQLESPLCGNGPLGGLEGGKVEANAVEFFATPEFAV
jgi:hypothetical protein